MSTTRNLARLATSGSYAVDTILALREFPVGVGTPALDTVIVRNYATRGDLGGGVFSVVTGDPGTFVDDGGHTILPTEGDGSVAYVRAVTGATLTPEMFGAVRDAVWTGTDWTGTNASPAIQVADDACAQLGFTLAFAGGGYYVEETIFKNRTVNWVGQARGLWLRTGTDWLGGTILCPSHSLSSVRSLVTGEWTNGVIDMTVDNTGNYFADLKVENVHVFGTPNGKDYYDPAIQCPRVAFTLNKITEFSIDLSVVGMRGVVAGTGWQDSYCEGTFQTCGHDTDNYSTACYAFDLRIDPRMAPGIDPGDYPTWSEFTGSNALFFQNSRWIICYLWATLEGWQGAGGIKFNGVKMEDKDHRLPEGVLRRNRPAFNIDAPMGDVFFGAGCQFRSQQDRGDLAASGNHSGEWLFFIANQRTVFDGVAFLSYARFINAAGSKGIVITNFTSQVCRNDVSIFALGDNAVLANGFMEQERRSQEDGNGLVIDIEDPDNPGTVLTLPPDPTVRNFATIAGDNCVVENIIFVSRDKPEGSALDPPGPVTSGALFSVDYDSDTGLPPESLSIDFSIESDTEFYNSAFPIDPPGEGDDFWEAIEVDRTGVQSVTWTDADWVQGEGDVGSANGILIRQRRRGYRRHYLNPQDSNVDFFGIIQCTVGERVTLLLDSEAAYNVVFSSSSKVRLNNVADTQTLTMGVDFDWIIFEAINGETIAEVARGTNWSL